MSFDETGSFPWRQQGESAVNEPWRVEESAAERFLRGAVAADPRRVTQALDAALRSAPAEAEHLIALAVRLVPHQRDNILNTTAKPTEVAGES